MADKKGKEIKALVEAVLNRKGLSYDDWLYQRHMECLAENSELVLAALNESQKKE
jgi:hypothetical protein